VRGSVSVKLLAVDSRHQFFAAALVVAVRDIEEKLRALDDDQIADADRKLAIDKQLEHIDGVGNASRVFAMGLANGRM